MNINSTQSTTYTNSASSSNGFSGLASGIDTDSMVEAMLANTQNKIDKQNALKQQIEWKQEIYRDIINKINTFQSTYFGTSSSSSLMNAALYNSMSAESTSKNFNVTATTSASVGNVDFEIRRLATNYSITSGSGVSGKLAGNINADALNQMIQDELKGNYKVKFNVDGTDVEVDLSSVFVTENNGTKTFKTFSSTSERDAAIKNALDTAFNTAGVNVTTTVSSGAISFSSGKKITVTAAENSIGLEKLGLKSGASSTEAKLGTHTLNGTVNAASTIDFTVTLDDLSKDIKLDMKDVQDALATDKANNNNDALKKVLQGALDKAHGTKQVQVEMKDNSFEFKVSAGRKVMIGGEKEVLDALGVKNGQSNRIGMGGALKDLYFANELQGSSFKFSINGVEFNFNENSYMSDVINEINKSSAGVRLVYRTQDDSFTLEAVDSGSGREIEIKQEAGNLINALLGNVGGTVNTGSTISSHTLTAQGNISATGLTADEYDIKDGSQLTIKVDGKEYTFKLDAKKEDGKEVKYQKEELIEELQKQISKEDGLKDKLEMDDNGNLIVNKGVQVEVVTTESDNEENIKKDLGLTIFGEGKNNIVSDEKKLSEYLTLEGGVSSDIATAFEGITLGSLKNSPQKIAGYKFSYSDGKITVEKDGATQNLNTIFKADSLENVFGTADVALGGADGSESVVVEGQNALIVVDGLLTERNSNNFSINGLNIDAKNITGTYTALGDASNKPTGTAVDGYDLSKLEDGWYLENGNLYDKDGVLVAENASVTIGGKNYATGIISDINSGEIKEFKGEVEEISVSRDTDKIVDTVKKFMDDYNKLIKELNDLVSEETSYREYAPLTEAQKKEMSEKEIELWEEKAKKGLLHGDSTITNLLQSMRSILYEKPEGSAYAIYNLGIETGEWESKGQLQFSENGETRLRQVLESDASGVQKLFADKTNGLFVKLNKTIDGAAKISSASPGALVQMAGVKGKATEKNNTLYRQLLDIESKIETLKDRYESEKTRYWNQFNSMEQLIANMNTQSSYIAQMLGY